MKADAGIPMPASVKKSYENNGINGKNAKTWRAVDKALKVDAYKGVQHKRSYLTKKEVR